MSTGTLTRKEICELVDLRQYFTHRTGDTGKRAGKAILAYSPFRNDGNKPGLGIYANGYFDFGGSRESGDAVQFVERLDGVSTSEAIRILAQFAGGSAAAAAPRQHDQRTSESEPPPMGWQTIASAAADEAARYLWSGATDAPCVLDYLHIERHLTDDTIRAAGLGFNPTWKKLKYRESADSEPITLPPGITIPYRVGGALWAIRVRPIVGKFAQYMNRPDLLIGGEPAPKYLNLTGSRASGVLYGADRLAQHGGAVLIVEGEFDALLAGQELDQVIAVTFGGASTAPAVIPTRWRGMLDTADRVYLALDGDEAGETASARLGRALPQSVRLTLPPGVKDVTELVQHGGDLRSWFDDQRNPMKAAQPDQSGEAAQTGIEVGLNAFGAKGETLVYRALCEGHVPYDQPVTFEDVRTGAEAAGFAVSERTLRNYFNAALESRKIFTPSSLEGDIGVNFFRTCETDLKKRLNQSAQAHFVQKCYPAEKRLMADPISGQLVERDPVLAPVPPRAFLDAAADEFGAELALDAAHSLQEARQALARPIRSKSQWTHDARLDPHLDEFARLLNSDRVIPLADGVAIENESDLKDAQMRAWEAAGVTYFEAAANTPKHWGSTRHRRCFALGVSEPTFKAMCARAGVQSKKNTTWQALDSAADPGKQIAGVIRNHKAFPKAYRVTRPETVYVVSPDGEILDKTPFSEPAIHEARAAGNIIHVDFGQGAAVDHAHPYDRAAVSAALEAGYRVEIEFQQANDYEVVSLPIDEPTTPPESARASTPRKPVIPAEPDPDSVPDERRRGKYSRRWLIGQLRYHYELKFNRSAPSGAGARWLVESIIGRKLQRNGETDMTAAADRLMDAIASAGGIARVSA